MALHSRVRQMFTALVTFDIIVAKCACLVISLFGAVFAAASAPQCMTVFQVSEQRWSPLRSLEEISQQKNQIRQKIQKKEELVSIVKANIGKALDNYYYYSVLEPNSILEKAVTTWLKDQEPKAGELPLPLEKALKAVNGIEGKDQLFNLLETTHFEITSDAELFATIRLCNQFIVNFRDQSKITDLLKSKVRFPEMQIDFSKGQKIHRLLNGLISMHDENFREFRNLIEYIKNPKNTEERFLYDGLRLISIETDRINDLQQQIREFDFEEKGKKLEVKILAQGIDLQHSKVSGVAYSEFHPEVAHAYLKIIDRLGYEFGDLVAFPAVQNRPNAFIRDALPLKQIYITPKKVWTELKKKRSLFIEN